MKRFNRWVASLVTFAMLALPPALLTGCASGEHAQNEARAYLQRMYGASARGATVSCMEYDSDDNGYVSCDAVLRDGRPIALECGAAISWNDGCKLRGSVFAP
jgi:hypothetical protein